MCRGSSGEALTAFAKKRKKKNDSGASRLELGSLTTGRHSTPESSEMRPCRTSVRVGGDRGDEGALGGTRAAREDNWPKVTGDDEKKERAK